VSEAWRTSNPAIYLFDAGHAVRVMFVLANSSLVGSFAGSSCPVAYRGDAWGSLDHLPRGGCHPPQGFCHLLIHPYCVYIATGMNGATWLQPGVHAMGRLFVCADFCSVGPRLYWEEASRVTSSTDTHHSWLNWLA
jgi:hypothetical protein